MRSFSAVLEAIDNLACVEQLRAGAKQGRLNGRLVMPGCADVRKVRPRRGNQRTRAVWQN